MKDMSYNLKGKMKENLEILEKYDLLFMKEDTILPKMMMFFKSMHEMLYAIETHKK